MLYLYINGFQCSSMKQARWYIMDTLKKKYSCVPEIKYLEILDAMYTGKSIYGLSVSNEPPKLEKRPLLLRKWRDG